MASKKIDQNIEQGLWANHGHPDDDYVARAGFTDIVDEQPYFISFHQGEMPAFNGWLFSTEDELEKGMRKLQPDLRKWRLVRE